MNAMTFQHLGQTWTIFQRTAGPDAAWYFAPRWGDRGQKVFHCFRDKTTRAALDRPAAIAAARQLIDARFRGPDQYRALRDATKLRDTLTVAKLLEDYQAAGCPDRRGDLRDGANLSREQANIKSLLKWWPAIIASKITDTHRDAYRVHRRDTVRFGDGARATEVELSTLNNALKWAWCTELLKDLPRSTKTSYRDAKNIAHRRFQMPDSGDELHALAGWLFSGAPASGPAASAQFECYGWTILLAAHTGLRAGELAMLLASPQRAGIEYPPGYIDEKFLRVSREKNGRNPKVALDDATRPHLRPLLDNIRAWHASRYPDHRYLLPGAGLDSSLNRRGFARALDAAAAALNIAKRCPHGLRAYYASARLAQGITPDVVATELGQGSGDELVRDVYGVDPDDFDATQWTSLADRFTWLPNTKDKAPAWTWWTAQPATNIVRL